MPSANDAETRERISRELSEFNRSAMLFSQSTPRLIETHDNQWVAALDGKVVAAATDVDDLFRQMAEHDIDPRYALVRHIHRNQRTLIL